MRRALQPSRILARGTVLRGLLLRRERSLGALLDVWNPEEETPEGDDRQHGGASRGAPLLWQRNGVKNRTGRDYGVGCKLVIRVADVGEGGESQERFARRTSARERSEVCVGSARG